jgi:hypothetical protein
MSLHPTGRSYEFLRPQVQRRYGKFGERIGHAESIAAYAARSAGRLPPSREALLFLFRGCAAVATYSSDDLLWLRLLPRGKALGL